MERATRGISRRRTGDKLNVGSRLPGEKACHSLVEYPHGGSFRAVGKQVFACCLVLRILVRRRTEQVPQLSWLYVQRGEKVFGLSVNAGKNGFRPCGIETSGFYAPPGLEFTQYFVTARRHGTAGNEGKGLL